MFDIKLHIEKFIRFHLFFCPVFGTIVLLGPDILKIRNNPVDFFQDTNSLILFGAIFLLFQLSFGAMHFLLISIKNRCLKSLNIYIIIQYICLTTNNILFMMKDPQKTKEQIKDSFWPFFFCIYVYLADYILFGVNLFQFKEKLWIEKGYPVQRRIIGIRLDRLLYPHFGLLIVLTLRDLSMQYLALDIMDRVLQVLPFYILNVTLNLFVRLGIFLFFLAVRTRNAKWIWRYRFAKILLQIPSCILWSTLTYLWFHTTPEIPIDRLIYFQPVFFATTFTVELILLQHYSNHFKDKPDNKYDDGELSEGAELLDRFCATQKISLLDVKFKSGVDDTLGEGQFGQVRKGELKSSSSNRVTVAVKFMKKEFTSKESWTSMVSEIKTLQKAQYSHENLVKFYGVMKSKTDASELGVVMEYCSLGSLKMYLIRKRAEATVHGTNGLEVGNQLEKDSTYKILRKFPDNIGPDELKKLKQWALQIASAMDFLGNLKIVHSDIASRNILLDEHECAKVTDFGMSLTLYNYALYARSNQSIFPWRWMAPESLADLMSSTRSDFYSYGVLLWELFTFGDTPWEGLEWTSDFVLSLEQGRCLVKPRFSSAKLYANVICRCLCFNETERLDFKEIQIRLLANEDGYINTM